MTTYNTGNPIGSTDARDLYDNAQNLDNFANGTASSYTDRLGVSRRSLAGIDSAADNVLNAIGYAVPVAYAGGISLTLTSQTVDYNGVIYAPKSSALPFTTSSWGADYVKFRAIQVTDADLITYTPAGTGAVSTTVQSKLREIVSRSDYSSDADYNAARSSLTGQVDHRIRTEGGTADRLLSRKLGEYVSVKDFGAIGDGITDDTAAIQAAINYAANINGDIAVNRAKVTTVFLPPGTYKVTSTLYIGWADYSPTSAFRYCNLEGIGRAEIYHIGTGSCLIVGNNTSYGILPAQIKNLKFRRDNNLAGTIAIQGLNAGSCVIENIGIEGFETGLWMRGCINAMIDGKRSFISSLTAIKIESYQPDAAVLRMAANLIEIQNYHLGNGASFGVVIQGGSGVSPSGAGGLIRLSYVTFESMTNSGIAIQVNANGEVASSLNQLDTVEIDHCWFENAGALLLDLSTGIAKMKHCWFGPQSAGSPVGVARLNDNYSSIWIDHCYGYNYSTPLVAFGASATPSIAKQRVYIGHYRKFNSGTDVAHVDWPVNALGVRPVSYKKFAVKYNSTYPAGNTDSNTGLALDLAAEAIKMFGTGWTFVDVTFVGQVNVSAANLGRVSVRVYNNNVNSLYPAEVIGTGSGTGYSLSGTTLTFSLVNGSAGWTQMIGVWECNTASGQY